MGWMGKDWDWTETTLYTTGKEKHGWRSQDGNRDLE